MMNKPNDYYKGINLELLELVPKEATNIIEIGCAEGKLAEILKQQNPNRYIIGFEQNPSIGEIAKSRMDEVYIGDIQTNLLPESLKLNSIDCVICGDVLEHLVEATSVLRSLLPYLKPNGQIVACIPNAQHYSIIQQMLTQNFQYHTSGLLDKTHVNLMTLPNMFKMFLDAGYKPFLRKTINSAPVDESFYNSLVPVYQHLNIDLNRAKQRLEAFQYLFVAEVNTEMQKYLTRSKKYKNEHCSLIIATNNLLQFRNNIAVSPDLSTNFHQIIPVTQSNNMASAWQVGLQHAKNNWIILVHQDVYLPDTWLEQIQMAWKEAENQLQCKIAMAGVAGIIKDQNNQYIMQASCIDRSSSLFSKAIIFPNKVTSLDELVLVFRKDRFIPEINPHLGFHFYGTDMAFKSKEAGFEVVVLDVPCLHNTSRDKPNIEDEDLIERAKILRSLWCHKIPFATSVATFLEDKIIMH